MNFSYQHGEQVYTVQLEQLSDGRFQAVVDGRAYTVRAVPVAEGGWLIEWGDGRALGYAATSERTRHVHIGGHTFDLSLLDTQLSRRRSAASSGDLAAQMPGLVIDVLASAGDTVERGQTLVILEAMKMEIRVNAPAAGVVERVLVERGAVVELGQLLVEMGATAE